MKTTTITAYTVTELQEQFPAAFRCAHDSYTRELREIPCQDETVESLKAVVSAAGLTLRDYNLGAYNRSNGIRVEFPGNYGDETADLTGKRALAWLENNLFSGLRVRPNMRIDDWRKQVDPATGHFRKGYRLDESARYYRTTAGKLHRREGRMGEVPSCPLTGYCADDDYLSSLRKDVRAGCTLKEAFENLADVCAELLEAEDEAQRSEDYFVDHATANDLLFDEDGEEVTDRFL